MIEKCGPLYLFIKRFFFLFLVSPEQANSILYYIFFNFFMLFFMNIYDESMTILCTAVSLLAM